MLRKLKSMKMMKLKIKNNIQNEQIKLKIYIDYLAFNIYNNNKSKKKFTKNIKEICFV